MRRIGLWAAAAALVCLGAAPSILGFGRGGAVRGGGVRVGGPGGGYAAGGYRGAAAVGPYGGGAAGVRHAGTVVGPTGTAGYRAGSNTVVTPRGGTVQYGGVATGRAGPAAAGGRYVGGVQVTTPGGRTATHVDAGRGAVGPRGAVGGSYHGGSAIGPYGAAHAGYRTGVAAGPYGAVGGYRGAVAARPGAVGGVRYGTYHVSRTALQTQGAYVRTGYRHYGAFAPTWYARYPGVWRAARWTAASVWIPATWGAVSAYCNYPATPVYYDYGSSVVYQGDAVYVDGTQVATAGQYAQQAIQVADAGRAAEPATEEWQPLGVFALVRGEEQTSDKVFQLAVNKDGVIRGNYYDAFADNALPVFGSVDKKSQRAAWSIGDKKGVVFEAGIANLTRDETPVLVHYGTDNTQQFTLVRLEQPQADQPR